MQHQNIVMKTKAFIFIGSGRAKPRPYSCLPINSLVKAETSYHQVPTVGMGLPSTSKLINAL